MNGPDDPIEPASGDDPLSSPDDAVTAFVSDVREAFPAEPLLAQEVHLEAIIGTAREIAARHRPPTVRKEHRMRFPKIRSRAAALVAGLVVAMSSFGGLAAAGALPGGVQDGVANVASTFGLALPTSDDDPGATVASSDDELETDAPDDEPTEAPEADEPEDEPTESPGADDDQGEDGDDQGEDEGDEGEDEDDQGEDEDADDGDAADEGSDDSGPGNTDDDEAEDEDEGNSGPGSGDEDQDEDEDDSGSGSSGDEDQDEDEDDSGSGSSGDEDQDDSSSGDD